MTYNVFGGTLNSTLLLLDLHSWGATEGLDQVTTAPTFIVVLKSDHLLFFTYILGSMATPGHS